MVNSYNIRNDGDMYDGLRFAIVEQAVNDYKSLERIEQLWMRHKIKIEIERFLLSEWCYALCGIDKGVWNDFIEKHKPNILPKEE